MYRIAKEIDGVEYLPDIVDTPIWKDYDEFECTYSIKVLGLLYIALSKRENYYQFNTPTAYGEPEYRYLQGVVVGILQASGMEEVTADNQIIIKKNNVRKLVIDKIKRPQSYYDFQKDNRETLHRLLG